MKHGYITVFFALVFMIFLSMIVTIFEGIRINAYRVKAECAFSAAQASVLGEYHTELLELYDLFYVDMGYKTNAPDYHQTESHLWKYISANMEILPSSVEINQMTLATDGEGSGYRNQISDYMQDKIGLSYIEEIMKLYEDVSKEGFLKENSRVNNPWEDKWQNSLMQKENIPKETLLKLQKYFSVEDLYTVRESFFLNQVLSDDKSVSRNKVNTKNLVSNRVLMSGTGEKKEIDLLDKIYFIEYAFEKFSCYSEQKEERPLIYEMEYLLGESGSDYENLSSVAETILAVRECMNLVYLVSDNEKMGLVREVSSALAAAIMSPEFEPVFEIILIVLWSYTESINDVKTLFEGDFVPLIKTDKDWKTFLGNGSFIENAKDSQQQDGMSYKQYLQLLMLFTADEKLTFRSMDLIEMNIQKITGNENFRMDGLADDFVVNVQFDIPKLGNYQIVRKFGYGI